MTTSGNPVRQLRIVIEADDYESAAEFFRDTLGMPTVASYSQAEDGTSNRERTAALQKVAWISRIR